MHPEGGRPVRDMPVPGAQGAGPVPLYVSCRGPKAQALARGRGDGAMTGILYPGGLAALDPALQERAAGYIAAVNAAHPPARRHQALHRGHLVELTLPEDDAVIDAGTIASLSFTGTADRLRERVAGLAADGVTELAVQPGGDVPAELRAWPRPSYRTRRGSPARPRRRPGRPGRGRARGATSAR